MPFKKIRIALSALVLLLGIVAAILVHLPLNGTTLYFSNAPETELYSLYTSYGSNIYVPERGYHRMMARSDGPVEVRINHRKLSKKVRFIRVDPGHAIRIRGLRVHRLTRLTFDTRILGWRVPMVDWPLEEIAATAQPMWNIVDISLDTGGALAITIIGRNPQFEFAFDYKLAKQLIPTSREWLARAMWLLVAGMLAALVYTLPAWLGRLRDIGLFLWQLLKTRGRDRLDEFGGLEKSAVPWALAGIALFVVLNLLRSWQVYRLPGLYIEDATHYFNFYYGGELGFSSIAEPINRYLAIGTHFFAWLFAKLDVRWQPGLYAGFAFVFASISVAAMSFSGLVRNRWLLLVMPTVLGLAGINHILFYNTLTEQIYVAIILLFTLLLWPMPRSRVAWLGLTLVAASLVWWGPYSVVVLPVGLMLLLFFSERRRALMILVCMLSAAFYFSTVQSGTAQWESFLSVRRLTYMWELLVSEVILLGLVDSVNIASSILAVALVAVPIYRLREDTVFVKIGLVLLVLIVLSLVPYVFSLKYMKLFFWPVHTVVSSYFWIVYLLLAMDRWLLHTTAPKRIVAPVLVAGLLAITVWDNRVHPGQASYEDTQDLTEFTTTLHQLEKLDLGARNQFVILDFPSVPGGISMPVHVGSHGDDARRLSTSELPERINRKFVQPTQTYQ